MNNDDLYQQLATSIAEDGFEQHAQDAVAYANQFRAELRLLEQVNAVLVDTINDQDLPDVVRARAFGKLRRDITDQVAAQLLNIDWDKSTLVLAP